MIRKNVFDQFNYGEDSKAEDFELWLKLNFNGLKLANLNKILYVHRHNSKGVSRQNEKEQKDCHNKASKRYLDQYLKANVPMQIVEILNNRPLQKVNWQVFKEAIQLYEDLYKKMNHSRQKELRKYYKQQWINIHIQSIKEARTIKDRLFISLHLIFSSLRKGALMLLVEKMK